MVTWKFDEINQRINIVGSTSIRATKAYLYHIKESLVTSGWGTVAASSTGTGGSWGYSDLWTASYDTVLGTHSWVIITSIYGQEICLQVSSDWAADRCGFICSPSGAFTYGSATITVRPTATDQIINAECTTTSNYNKIHDGDLALSRSFHVWTDTVGKNFMAFIGRPNAPYLCGNFIALWYLENRVTGDVDPYCLVRTYDYLDIWALGYRTQPGIYNHGRMRVEHPSAGNTIAGVLMPRISADYIEPGEGPYYFLQHSCSWDKYTPNTTISFPFLIFTTSSYRYCGQAPTGIKLMPDLRHRRTQPLSNVFYNDRDSIKIDGLLLPWDGSSMLI